MLATASAREYCAGSTRRASSVDQDWSGMARSSGHFPFGRMQTTWASALPYIRAMVRPPIQQAEALSAWCSRREASPMIWEFVPLQTAEVIGQGDARQAGSGRRSAAFPDRDVVVNAQRKRNDLLTLRLENFAIRVEDEVILEVAADFLVASGNRDGEAWRRASIDGDVEIHRQGRSIKGRAQIRRGGWKGQMQRGRAAGLFLAFLLGHSLLFLLIRVRGIGFFCSLQRFDHGVQRSIKNDGRVAEGIQLRALLLVRRALK